MSQQCLRLWIFAAWSCLLSFGLAQGQTLPAVGDQGHLWLAIPHHASATLTLYHHHQGTDANNTMRQVRSLHGQTTPGALAATGDTLWVVYTDGAVQTIQAQPSATVNGWAFQGGLRASLPAHTALRSLTASRLEPWALVRVESPQPPRSAATEPALDLETAALDLTLGLPPNTALSPSRKPSDAQTTGTGDDPDLADPQDKRNPDDQQPDQDQSLDHPADMLLRLVRGRWESVALPEDWPHAAPAKMAFGQEEDRRPTLMAQVADQLVVYRWSDETWHRQVLPGSASAACGLLRVAGQLVVTQAERQAVNPLAMSLSVLRPSGLNPIGTLSLPLVGADGADPTVALRQWSGVSVGQQVALMTADQGAAPSASTPPEVYWTRMDLQGRQTLEPTPMQLTLPVALEATPGFAIQVGVLILATILIVTFWRRQPRARLLALPSALVLAPLGRRALAGAIDLLPGVLAGTVGFGVGLNDLYLRWPTSPDQGMTWPGMAPGVVVISVFLVHVTVAECVFGRSLGKWITRLRVTTMAGSPPTVAAMLVRNLLKTFDLLAWLLLLLPMIGPYRQRLGDMVAQTVVVQSADEASGQTQEPSDDA